MNRLAKIALLFAFILFLSWGATSYYLKQPSITPESAIRKYVFCKGNPFEALNLNIRRTNVEDPYYGHQFIVKGYYDDPGPVQIMFFYLKRSQNGWYVTSAGTGP